MDQRLDHVRTVLEREQLDALLVTDEQNRYYLSGFSGSAGALLITADRALLLSDFRYRDQAAAEAPDWEFRLIKPPEIPEGRLIATSIAKIGTRRVGFEAAHMTVATHCRLRELFDELASDTQLEATEGLVEAQRAVKDAGELRTLERAIAITDEAFAAVRPLLRPTMREREVAWELEKAMREAGADGLAFSIIVAAGPNGARPHARAGDSQLGTGRPVVMDFGARVAGYHADMTRTVILGTPDEQFEQVYREVLQAQQHAARHIRAGMSGREADALARDLITAAGYGDNFGHGLGHGVGLAIHEAPSLRAASDEPLPVGAVCSIEPGIYLPGWGGVRIEDLVTLTDGGARTLTQSSKEPVIALD